MLIGSCDHPGFNPDCAVESVARRRKQKRNAQLERFCDVGILINMSRSKIGEQALQQGFAGRSRRLMHNLVLIIQLPPISAFDPYRMKGRFLLLTRQRSVCSSEPSDFLTSLRVV
jgi:hypothetical protein